MTTAEAYELTEQERRDYARALVQHSAYEAVCGLWHRRKADGWTQKMICDRMGRNPGWVSRQLAGPANWTLFSLAELVEALDGEVEIIVTGKEDIPPVPHNYDAYHGYRPHVPMPKVLSKSSNTIKIQSVTVGDAAI